MTKKKITSKKKTSAVKKPNLVEQYLKKNKSKLMENESILDVGPGEDGKIVVLTSDPNLELKEVKGVEFNILFAGNQKLEEIRAKYNLVANPLVETHKASEAINPNSESANIEEYKAWKKRHSRS